ncbi:hypothetical protein AB0E04_43695 [Streptomyces sp. NPDC048251]|uniref:hypothetical protein n=1 Tax=Streptomyces sp. NPDC048251 TaxID=3154501 RepID=UPI003439286D
MDDPGQELRLPAQIVAFGADAGQVLLLLGRAGPRRVGQRCDDGGAGLDQGAWAAATPVHHLHTLHPTEYHPAQWAAAHAALDNPFHVARLLKELRLAGTDEQVTALLARDPASHAALDNPDAVANLLEALRLAGAHEQTTLLVERLPAAGHFDLFIKLGGNRRQFRLGREPNGSTAPSWRWNDMD